MGFILYWVYYVIWGLVFYIGCIALYGVPYFDMGFIILLGLLFYIGLFYMGCSLLHGVLLYMGFGIAYAV